MTAGQPLTLTRDQHGYWLEGDVGGLMVAATEPLSAEAAERYCALFGRGAVLVELPEGDPLARLGRGDR